MNENEWKSSARTFYCISHVSVSTGAQAIGPTSTVFPSAAVGIRTGAPGT